MGGGTDTVGEFAFEITYSSTSPWRGTIAEAPGNSPHASHRLLQLEILGCVRFCPCRKSELSPRVGGPTVAPLQLTRRQRELDRSCLCSAIGYGLEVAKTKQAGLETVCSIYAGPDPVEQI